MNIKDLYGASTRQLSHQHKHAYDKQTFVLSKFAALLKSILRIDVGEQMIVAGAILIYAKNLNKQTSFSTRNCFECVVFSVHFTQ